MTNARDIINDFGKKVVEIGATNLTDEEIKLDENWHMDRYDEALDDCMDRLKIIMGME